MGFAAAVSSISTLLLAPFFAYIALIVAAALRPVRRGPGVPPELPRFLILIPAHDEEGGIGETVSSCSAVTYPGDRFRVVVVADNCSDRTADAARRAGAEVIERSDPERRSKGYAIEYALARPEVRGFDAVAVIDADTVVDPGLLSAFAAEWGEGRDWLQAYYTVRNADASWRTRLMTHAFSLFNGVWPVGHQNLGLGAGLKGNGMCFSARGLARVPFRAYGLVEDLEFSWTLRTRGESVRFVPGVRVSGEMVRRGGPASASQRRRWEAGRRSLPGKFLGPILRSPSLGPYRKLMFAIQLIFPTLTTLALGLAAASGASLLAALGPASVPLPPWPPAAQAMMAAILAAYALSPIPVMGLPPRYLGALLALPYYAVWKLAVSSGRGPSAWVRTAREAERPLALVAEEGRS